MSSAHMGKIVVVGSTNTDLTVRVPRIPAPGETALGRDFRISAGGKGANQAVAAARAGARVIFVTALGMDDFGDRAVENLAHEAIDVSLVRRVTGVQSGVALIAVDDRGENSIAVAAGANSELRPDDVEELRGMVDQRDVMLLQLEIPLATVEAAARLAAERGATVILNPAPAQPLSDEVVAAISVLTPNEHEVEQLTGQRARDEEELRLAAGALHARGVNDVLITLGAGGVFASAHAIAELVPGFAVEAVDTTAAGDVFNGALAVSLVEGLPLRDALEFANAAAALSVTRAGAQASAPRRHEIDAFLRDRGRPVPFARPRTAPRLPKR
jgi:ribokinase